ncbi:hypothetical protein [Rhodococcus sp. NPDC058521]|uniref:hypothetical protein n=1 Tax=Rhodococcus sp. NPDC058521 TaxID=3346536 RepID=UPI0036560CCE
MDRCRSTASAICLAAMVAVSGQSIAFAAPAPIDDFNGVPERTALTFEYAPGGILIGTTNQHDSRPGLSTVKLYMADYALRRGDGSPSDRALAERMIRYSDDTAASELDAKYPGAIDAVAAEFGLADTRRSSFWGDSYTSTADTVAFLMAKRADPLSPIPVWMSTASPTAADGTVQDWGTARLPGVVGTKWGWSDQGGSPVVASASFGPDFTIAANTYGSPEDHTADVLGAFTPGPGPLIPEHLIPDIPGLDDETRQALVDDLNEGLANTLPE